MRRRRINNNGAGVINPCTVLRVVNEIFETDCLDSDAVDVSATWQVIAEELSGYQDCALTLALWNQENMPVREVARLLGVSRERIYQKHAHALRKLREPGCLRRIQNSIVGWPNLFRNPPLASLTRTQPWGMSGSYRRRNSKPDWMENSPSSRIFPPSNPWHESVQHPIPAKPHRVAGSSR